MKKLLIIGFIFLSFFISSIMAKAPKIVVFTSDGGNGHKTACEVLKETFPDCEIKLVNPIYDFFKNVFDGEGFYNKVIQSGWIHTSNFVARYIGKPFFKIRTSSFKKRFLKYLENEKPDVLISVIPLINYPAAWAANKCNIPFFIITLDADLELWLLNMEKCHNLKFNITVNAKTQRIKKQLKQKRIPESCVLEVGSPLRKNFLEQKDCASIRKEWNIPEDKKVIMLMRGGTGSVRLVDYVRSLAKINKPIHLLVCVGRNSKLIPKINRIKTNEMVTFSVIPFTQKIPELMSISDLLITQPSPNVCNEAMHMNLPILIDRAMPSLFWEKATIDWIHMQGNGTVFRSVRRLNKLVESYLDKKNICETKKLKKELSFNTQIRNLVMKSLENKNIA